MFCICITETKCRRKNVLVSLHWGIANETIAVEEYMDDTFDNADRKVESCGLVVYTKLPWLGCSPDGIIVKGGVPVGCI